MKYKAVIFDMDGTILYTLEDIVLCMNEALRRNGLPEITEERIRVIIGHGIMNEVRGSVPDGTDPEITEKVYEDFNELYAVHCMDHTKPYDGIIELIGRLRRQGVKTAVVSNKGDYAVRELNDIIFPGLFEASAGEKEGIAKKPAPDTVFAVLKEMDVSAEEAVYVGDSEVDLQTARNAGMDCIIVSWGYRTKEQMKKDGAECIVDTMDELFDKL